MTCVSRSAGGDRRMAVVGVALSIEDWACIRQYPMLDGAEAHSVGSCRELNDRIQVYKPDIVISGSELPDGTWRNALAACQALNMPPPVVVACRLADEHLWAEVLNLGGFDLIASPLNARELGWIIKSALKLQDPFLADGLRIKKREEGVCSVALMSR